MKKQVIVILICLGLFMPSCASDARVRRLDTKKDVDLSGRWNDGDSRRVSEAMIEDCLSRPWIDRFKKRHNGRLPVVTIGTIRNRSHEHINRMTFTKDIEMALINSGEVDFVAGIHEREELREELKQQAIHSSEETAKSAGEEIAADFMLNGWINTIQDRSGGREIMYYQVNLELINIQTHRKAWIGEKKIKKYIKRSRFRP